MNRHRGLKDAEYKFIQIGPLCCVVSKCNGDWWPWNLAPEECWEPAVAKEAVYEMFESCNRDLRRLIFLERAHAQAAYTGISPKDLNELVELQKKFRVYTDEL